MYEEFLCDAYSGIKRSEALDVSKITGYIRPIIESYTKEHLGESDDIRYSRKSISEIEEILEGEFDGEEKYTGITTDDGRIRREFYNLACWNNIEEKNKRGIRQSYRRINESLSKATTRKRVVFGGNTGFLGAYIANCYNQNDIIQLGNLELNYVIEHAKKYKLNALFYDNYKVNNDGFIAKSRDVIIEEAISF